MMKFVMISFLLLNSLNSIDQSKMLIIYFTRTGNTEIFSDYIKELSNITSYKIVPTTPYPQDYNQMLTIAREEQSNGARPEIQNPLTDISKYDNILLGYPLWFSHLPNIVITQLEKLNFTNKNIYPFNTHGSSGVGSSLDEIKQYAKGANVKDGFPIKGDFIRNNKEDSIEKIEDWLDDNFDNEADISDETIEDINTNSNSIGNIAFKYLSLIGLLLFF